MVCLLEFNTPPSTELREVLGLYNPDYDFFNNDMDTIIEDRFYYFYSPRSIPIRLTEERIKIKNIDILFRDISSSLLFYQFVEHYKWKGDIELWFKARTIFDKYDEILIKNYINKNKN